jgi:uncharacterized membrane protein
MMKDPLRFHRAHKDKHGAFGNDAFGRVSERVARFLGTPKFILMQTVIVLFWIALNVTAVAHRWDPYPFILLNLAFSTQAAYAAPMILLAQTRQADRDKAGEEADALHREALALSQSQQLTVNIDLTTAVRVMTEQQTTILNLIRASTCEPE